MGNNGKQVQIKPQKELTYCNKLIQAYSKDSFTKSALAKLKLEKKERYTQTELSGILEYKGHTTANRFLKKLIEAEILYKDGEKLTASKPVPTYSLNKKELINQLIAQEWYQKNKNLISTVVDKAGDF